MNHAEHAEAAVSWLRTKDNQPEIGREYWVITHSLKQGHRPGVGYLIGKDLGWSVNGSSGGMPRMRPRVVWHAEIIYPEICAIEADQ